MIYVLAAAVKNIKNAAVQIFKNKIGLNVKKFRIKYFFLSILSGLLIALSFQKFNAFFLAWIAFIPLIYCLLRNCVRNSLIYGFLSGMVCYIVSLYWIFPFLQYNTNSNIQSLIAAGLLWVYLSLYFLLWSALLSLTRRHFHPLMSSFFAASAWVMLEFVRMYFLTGFGWNLLGYSQSSFVYLIQIADIAGVYGVSFLIIFINMLLYYWIQDSRNKQYLIQAAAILIIVLGYGFARTSKYSYAYGEKISVGIVQPNIDQYKKWDNSYTDEIIKTLKESAEQFRDKELDIIIYPETAMPGFLQSDIKLQELIKNISGFAQLNLIGAPSVYDGRVYNSVLAIKKDGSILNKHNKNHLVIFGEYIPLRKHLSKYFGVLNSLGDFSKAKAMQIFKYNNISAGPTICSENFFPDLARKSVVNGSKILTNHTNDAWFFDSFAPYQHFVMNIFRAVENRKNIIISANTGLSAIIDASGNVAVKTDINQNYAFASSAYQNEDITIYDKIGDLFAYICVVVTLFVIVLVFII